MSCAREDSPVPLRDEVVDEGDAAAFIPYPDIGEKLEQLPMSVRPDVLYYRSRMGFLPNTIKLYLHTPWIAEHLFRLNNALMRDERGLLSEHFKYRLALVASRDNECEYCTAHHVATLRARWGDEEHAVESVLKLEDARDEREAAAFEFVHQASLDPAGVTDELRARLAAHYSPGEIMEIVQVIGFWKMYNTMHTAMAAPLEDPVRELSEWVNVRPAVGPDTGARAR
jgi:uncharacterized peroxidase-related enzyme